MKKEKKILNEEEKKHKKKKRIITTSIVLGSIALLSIPLGVWFGYVDPSLSNKINPDEFYSKWMSYVKDETKLNELIIPGSHDAGTNKMMPQAMTQGHDFDDQLRGGVRYFDTRVTSKGDDLVIYHGPIKGQSFKNVLEDTKEFISKNPSEFIILDFQHIEEKSFDKIVNLTKKYLPDEVLLDPTTNSFSSVTLGEIRAQKKNIALVFKENNKDKKYLEDAKLFLREDSLDSPYISKVHKSSDEELIKQFDTYLNSNDHSKLFVLQAQKTAKTLLGKPSMYEKSFDPKVNKYIDSLNTNLKLLNKTNIIMRDFVVSNENKVKTILKLNLTKNLVKEENKSVFTKKLA